VAIVRIDFSKNQPAQFGPRVASIVNTTMMQVLSVPTKENYVVCQSHEDGMVLHDPENITPDELKKILFIQVTLNYGRTEELKRMFFSTLTKRISEETGTAPENVFIISLRSPVRTGLLVKRMLNTSPNTSLNTDTSRRLVAIAPDKALDGGAWNHD
jgi:4-oxalocrotonate tautomerase